MCFISDLIKYIFCYVFTFLAPVHQYTDDTVMTICVAESLVENKGFDDKDLAKRYVILDITLYKL